MFHKQVYLYIVLCLSLFLLAGCTMPASKGPTAIPSVAITQAVQTMAAQLTATPVVSNQPTVTQQTASATAVTPTARTVEATNTPPSPTFTSEPETAVVPTNSPDVTRNPNDPVSGLSNPDWHETFDGTSAWYSYQDENIRFQTQDHKLEMTAFQANNRNGWALVPKLASSKYYVEMTATFGNSCKGADHFGLMISPVSSADKGYLFGISCDGKYILWKWDGTRMTTLAKWSESTLIQAGESQTNRIGIEVNGNKLSLFANGSLLNELTDPTYEKLYFGVFVGAAETAGFTIQVNSLDYWSLP